ncbi:arf-GAP with coiled-coil, ANK repeat and PH domain-containing protein 2 [Amia ocellicauda]|uniref:arf-GAP with coiled-coil, ANK repeat and PH domain-containing protein 2 n=1 Tax=Amia ocellicauda TaxID=2972642 RepID=UPI0034648BB5
MAGDRNGSWGAIEEAEADLCLLESKLNNAGLTIFSKSNQPNDQAQRSVRAQLQTFVTEDLSKFKNSKKHFDKVSKEKEVALVKNAQAARNKQHKAEEATYILNATQKSFRRTTVDYVQQINVLQSKRSEVLRSLEQLVVDEAKQKWDIEQNHSTIQQEDISMNETKVDHSTDTDNGIAMEGYLFKRAHNRFKTWQRRWFSIQNNQLVYQKTLKDKPTVVIADMRLCTVKPSEDSQRRFCFEVISPSKSYMLQADSEDLRKDWIQAIQNSIVTAFEEDISTNETKVDHSADTDNGIAMEGYLFKRSHNRFRTWHGRCWFSIQNNQLVYQKTLKDKPTVVIADMRLCTMKPSEDSQRRFCFEVISPSKSYMLQADSEDLRKDWIQAIQNSIVTAFEEDISTNETKVDHSADTDNGIAMEGYLFKRSHNRFKTWQRRWFSIQNNQLVYQKTLKDKPTVFIADMRLCTVKPSEDSQRCFCFEVISPSKSYMLQADSEDLRKDWIQAIRNSIVTAFEEKMDQKQMGMKRNGKSVLKQVLSIPGNANCCDCGNPDPRWASINLGITLCIECSGIHRSLGVHISKVRSLTLDNWEPESIELMCELGNGVINDIYEARREELDAEKPQAGNPREKIEAYIRAKYINKAFVPKDTAAEVKEAGMNPSSSCSLPARH